MINNASDNRQVITVSNLNAYIKASMDQDVNLRNVYLVGEVSNYKKHNFSGHIYFSLKDDNSIIKAVMFSGNTKKLSFDVKDGMRVIAFGKVSCYEVAGQYQFYAQEIQPDGIGSVYMAYEQLKSRLEKEGLFKEEYKRELPRFPRAIGVITSKTGAVIHDIKTVSNKRYPLCDILLYPTQVQGETASEQIIEALDYFNKEKNVDAIIVGRGGGSIEDLWAFNDEKLARKIYSSNIPIVSAVGHETDFTICDFVADRRAATPSEAAEMLTPDISEIKDFLTEYKKYLIDFSKFRVNELSNELVNLKSNFKSSNFVSKIDLKMQELKNSKLKIFHEVKSLIETHNTEISLIKKRLFMCSIESNLKRGYLKITKYGMPIKSSVDISENDRISVIFPDKVLEFNVTNISVIERK